MTVGAPPRMMTSRHSLRHLLVLLLACGGDGPAASAPTSRAAATPAPVVAPVVDSDPRPVRTATLAEVGLDASIMDPSAGACTDLYQLACGQWMKSTPIPPDSVGFERSFGAMRKNTEQQLRAMLEQAAATPGDDPARKMLGDFYAACLDQDAIAATAAKPIRPMLDRLERATSREELVRVLASVEGLGVYALVNLGVAVDDLDSSRMTATLRKTGWTLPRREYVEADAKSVAARAKYRDTLRAMFAAAGTPPATIDRRVSHAMTVETLLSISDDPSADSRPPPTRLGFAELVQRAPGFPWAAYLRELGLDQRTAFNVTEPTGLGRLSDVMASQSLEALRDYAQARVLHDLTYVLSPPFTSAKQALAAHRSGRSKGKERWQECLKITEHTLPRAAVREYARFVGFDRADPELKLMVEDVHAAWTERLTEVDWLDAPTRGAALRKLAAMPHHIGHPELSEVERFDLDRRTFAENVFRADRAKHLAELKKLDRDPDRAEWTRSPLEVNAYHDHERNSIFLHMAMLQPPIYDRRASVPVRYGVMGMTIAHELAHGFDHHGADFDDRGTRRDWWSAATRQDFGVRQRCFEEQFSTYEILPGLKVDGKRSVGENMADVAGLRMAFRAYRKRRTDAKERVVADGYTEDQQFFLARAQAWCVVMTDDAARDAQRTNPHIFPRWAVNGPTHHLTEFHQAFGCELPKDMCSAW